MRRKILAFLLTLTLALLISCGGTENRILTNVFRPELLCRLADRDYIGMEWQDGKLFAAYLTESELSLLVTDGKVSDESALALPDAPGGGVYPQCFTLTPDGNPVVIFSISSDGQSLPETFAAVYAGNEIAEFTKLDGFLGTADFVSADDEVIYAASGSSIALTDGTKTSVFDAGGEIIALGNGRTAFGSNGKYYAASVGPDGISDREEIALDNLRSVIFADSCYADTTDAVYEIIDGKPVVMLSWKNSSIDHSQISRLFIVDSDNAVCIRSSGISNEPQLVKLTRVPDGEAAEKTAVTLGVTLGNSSLDQAISDFNQTNGLYRIEVVNYAPSKSDPDALKRLELDMASGNLPDLIQYSSNIYSSKLQYTALARKGAFCDLSSLFDPEDFAVSLPESSGGEMYLLPCTVSIGTMTCKAGIVGDDWCFDRLTELCAKNSSFLTFDDRGTLLEMLLEADIRYASDKNALKKLLAFAKELPGEYPINLLDEDERQDYESDRYKIYREDICLFWTQPIRNLNDYMTQKGAFGGNFVFAGCPTLSGSVNLLLPMLAFSMSSRCAETDGALEFLHFILNGDYYSFGQSTAFPATKTGLDRYFSTARETKFWYNPTGNAVASASFDRDGSYELEFTVSDEKVIRELIGSALFQPVDDGLTSIIREDSEVYFSGAKGLDETVSVISDRVSTRIAELDG